MSEVIIFTDGACSGNPGPGGWGAVVVCNGFVKELGGGLSQTTNNQMEILSVIESLKYSAKKLKSFSKVLVHTDSVYVIRGITQWIWGWKKNNWKTAEGNPVSNQTLWMELEDAVKEIKKIAPIEWHYVRGHTDVPGNERCDVIGVAYSHGEYVHLYEGSLAEYDLDILRVPSDTSLPVMKPKSAAEKKAAYYISYMNGVVSRYKTWGECEQAVKGRPGVKFKKVTDPAEEPVILKSWGVS